MIKSSLSPSEMDPELVQIVKSQFLVVQLEEFHYPKTIDEDFGLYVTVFKRSNTSWEFISEKALLDSTSQNEVIILSKFHHFLSKYEYFSHFPSLYTLILAIFWKQIQMI